VDRSDQRSDQRSDERSALSPVDDPSVDRLDRYRAAPATAEPPDGSAGTARPTGDHRFVVQRHRATNLHYDLRLEAAGVLVSWAVPKGPTLDPKVRRLAVHVEDHHLDHFDFEGAIPRDEYGGGDVTVWDWGTWSLAKGDDPVAAIAAGDLHFFLDGVKLLGRFVLLRTGPPREKEQWLLLHKQDDFGVPGWEPETYPRSVKSGRTNDELQAAATPPSSRPPRDDR